MHHLLSPCWLCCTAGPTATSGTASEFELPDAPCASLRGASRKVVGARSYIPKNSPGKLSTVTTWPPGRFFFMYSGFELWRVTTCGKPKLIGFFTTIMSHFPPLEGERKRTPKSIVVFLQSCSTVEELIQPGSFWAKLQNHPNLRRNDVCRFSI